MTRIARPVLHSTQRRYPRALRCRIAPNLFAAGWLQRHNARVGRRHIHQAANHNRRHLRRKVSARPRHRTNTFGARLSRGIVRSPRCLRSSSSRPPSSRRWPAKLVRRHELRRVRWLHVIRPRHLQLVHILRRNLRQRRVAITTLVMTERRPVRLGRHHSRRYGQNASDNSSHSNKFAKLKLAQRSLLPKTNTYAPPCTYCSTLRGDFLIDERATRCTRWRGSERYRYCSAPPAMPLSESITCPLR